jgi:hypothetical protein
MTFDNSSDLFNNLSLPHFGYPNPTATGGQFAGMFGQPLIYQGNVPPPMVNYGQASASGIPQQTLGGPSMPVIPKPADPNNQSPTDTPPSTTAIADSGDVPGDFLKVVRDTVGGIAHGALDALGVTNYLVAQPAYMELMHPLETNLGLIRGAAKGQSPFETINQMYQESDDPGLIKFLGATALDPLTYAGGLGLAGKAAQIPKIGGALSKAITIGETPFRLADRAVTGTGSAIGTVGMGVLNNELDLTPVKDAIRAFTQSQAEFTQTQHVTRQILGKILPGSTVENILNTLPDTYTGLNITPLSNAANAAIPNLGLPAVLKIPEVRVLTISNARAVARSSIENTFASRLIDPTLTYSSQEDVQTMLHRIYSSPPEKLLHNGERQFQALLREPLVLGSNDFNTLSRMVGGNIRDPNDAAVRTFNSIVGQYRRGPAIDPIGGLDQRSAVTALGQLVGADLSNPDNGFTLSRFLQGRTDQSRLLLSDLAKRPPGEILDTMVERAANQARGNWDLKIQAERDQNTLFDQALNKFDGAYTAIYKNLIASEISGPLSKEYLKFTGFVPMNAVETYVRQILGGGGFRFNRLSNDEFRRATAYYPDVPPRLLELSPGERAAAQSASNLSESITGIYGQGRGPLASLANNPHDPFNKLLDWGNDLEMGLQRNAYLSFVDAQRDAVAFQKGLILKNDMQAYYAAAKPLDVTSVPELQGVSQDFIDGFTKHAAGLIGNPDNYDSMVAAINAGSYNREKLAGIVDSEDLINSMHPLSRDIFARGMRGAEPTSEGFGKVIDATISNEKKIIDSDPAVIEAKFGGINTRIQKLVDDPNTTAETLSRAYNHLHALQSQFSDLPQQLRQGEYEEIRHVMGETQSGWRRALHNEWNQRFQDSLDRVGTQLEIANQNMLRISDKLGTRPQMERVTDLLRQDQQLTIDTWKRDLEFQQDFFANNRIGKRVTNLDAYYLGRNQIWEDYYGRRSVIKTFLDTENASMTDAIMQKRVAEGLQKQAEAGGLSPNTWRQTARSQGSIQASYGPHTIGIDASGKNSWQYTLNGEKSDVIHRTQKEAQQAAMSAADSLIGPSYPMSGDIGQDAIAQRIIQDIRNSADGDHTVWNTNYDSIANDARLSGGQSDPNGGRDTSGQPISASRPDQPSSAGSNGHSADPIDYDNNGVIANRYAAANALRQRLESGIVDVVNNPAVTDTQIGKMTEWAANFKKEWNSLTPENQHTLNETNKEAVSRATELFKNSYVDYDGRNKFDWLMQHLFPFWMYESRRFPFLLQQGVKRPALAEAYNRYMDSTDQGYIPLGEIPYEVNPLRGTVFGAISQVTDPDRPMKYTYGVQASMESINATLAKFGVYLGPAFSIPTNVILGQAGSSLPPSIQGGLNIAHSANLPVLGGLAGQFQAALPDPFKDYYTRMILASQGHEPDKIYQGAMDDPNGNEANVLDGAVKQSDLVSTILRQTGFLRYRTPEYTQYRQARESAIAELSGISPTTQENLRDMGKTVYQIHSFSPEQQDLIASVPGTKEFNQITQPLLNPAAAQQRLRQREFFDTVATKRDEELAKQLSDDNLKSQGLISGKQWRDRYQARISDVSTMMQNLKATPQYKNVPITAEEQAAARTRYNLPAYVDDPISIGLNKYYAIQPEPDVTGEVDWSKFFDARSAFLKANPTIAAEIQRKSEKNDTVQVQDFKRAAQVLRPYFGLTDEIAKRYPQLEAAQETYDSMKNVNPLLAAEYRDNNSSLQILSRMISQARDAARKQFPQIDAALVEYYGGTPISYEEFTKKAPNQPSGKFAGMFGIGLNPLQQAALKGVMPNGLA